MLIWIDECFALSERISFGFPSDFGCVRASIHPGRNASNGALVKSKPRRPLRGLATAGFSSLFGRSAAAFSSVCSKLKIDHIIHTHTEICRD